MNRVHSLLSGCALTMALHGCGPMNMPMPVRLDAETQQSIDQSWGKAMSPVDHLKHQPLLDVFLVTQAYQIGVDKLTFRSEKTIAMGTIVMDIKYDRARPDQDRFAVKVYDPAQKLLREENYNRKEIEDSYRDLFVRCNELKQKMNNGQALPDEVKQLASLEARLKAVQELFPQQEKPAPAGKAPAR